MAPLLKKKKKQKLNIGNCFFAHTNTNTRFVQIMLIKELMLGEGNIASALHYTYMGVTSFGQSSLKWFWWCRYVEHDATLLCNATHLNGLFRHCQHIGWSWVWGHLQGGVRGHKVNSSQRLTSCLSYWLLLRLSIKEGAKPTMFLPSMVQSAFPGRVHRNVALCLEPFVAKKPAKSINVLLQILQCSWLAPASAHLSASFLIYMHSEKWILLLFEEELFWLCFFSPAEL